jgi:invasion protein IalB
MHLTRAILIAAFGAALAGAALAQDEPAEAETPPAAAEGPAAGGADAPDSEPAPDAEGEQPPAAQGEQAPPEGETAGTAPAQPEVVEIVRDEFQDWQVRCAPDETECFLYQLASDDQDNPVAEVSLLKLPEGAEADAGMTVVTPLGTLLPEGIGLQIDQGEGRRYPFTFCSQVGCFARFPVDVALLNRMKGGRVAHLTLRSVIQPQQPLELDISLAGFTAAYDSLEVPEVPAGQPATPPPEVAPLAPADDAPLAPQQDAPLAPAD